MPTKYYTNCVCPHCKAGLDEIVEMTPACPTCNQALDRSAVWATRKYPGVIFLPHWISAFGWPLLLILGGVGFGGWIFWVSGKMNVYLPAVPISIGLVFFIVKLSGADR